MGKLYNLARVNTATVGTGTITLGAAVSGYLTFALAGVADGDVVSYGISDGANSEVGTGTYTLAGTTLSRTPTVSTNSNAAISLSGSAQVFITARAEDIQGKPAFYAHKDFTNQTSLVHATYNTVTWPAKLFDIGNYFDTANNWWVPPAGYVAMHSEVYQTSHAASSNGTFVAKIQRQHSGITITNASPAVFSWPLHGLVIGQTFIPTTSGSLPTGLTAGNVYYIQSTPTNGTFTVAATHGGAAINTSSAGSGTHTGTIDVGAGIGSAVAGLAGLAVSQVTVSAAYSNGTDRFIVIYFTTSDDALNDGALDSNPAHTHFSGNWLGQ